MSNLHLCRALVDGAPEPMLLPGDRDHDLVEMPDVARTWFLPPEPAGVIPPEFQGPAPNRLVGDNARSSKGDVVW